MKLDSPTGSVRIRTIISHSTPLVELTVDSKLFSRTNATLLVDDEIMALRDWCDAYLAERQKWLTADEAQYDMGEDDDKE